MKHAIVVLLVCAMLIFGCSAPKDAANQSGGNESLSKEQTGGTESSAQPASSGIIDEVSAKPAVEKRPIDELTGYMSQSRGWTVSYNISSGGISIENVQFFKAGKIRNDFVVGEMETRSYLVNGKYTSCVNMGSGWTCSDYSGTAGGGPIDLSQSLQANPEDYTVVRDGTESIAGTTGACYLIMSANASTRYCVSPEGVPLYLKIMENGEDSETLMVAKSYKASADDADFILPQ